MVSFRKTSTQDLVSSRSFPHRFGTTVVIEWFPATPPSAESLTQLSLTAQKFISSLVARAWLANVSESP